MRERNTELIDMDFNPVAARSVRFYQQVMVKPSNSKFDLSRGTPYLGITKAEYKYLVQHKFPRSNFKQHKNYKERFLVLGGAPSADAIKILKQGDFSQESNIVVYNTVVSRD